MEYKSIIWAGAGNTLLLFLDKIQGSAFKLIKDKHTIKTTLSNIVQTSHIFLPSIVIIMVIIHWSYTVASQ